MQIKAEERKRKKARYAAYHARFAEDEDEERIKMENEIVFSFGSLAFMRRRCAVVWNRWFYAMLLARQFAHLLALFISLSHARFQGCGSWGGIGQPFVGGIATNKSTTFWRKRKRRK